MPRPPNRIAILAAALALVTGLAVWTLSDRTQPKRPLALFTTLPIYWSETGALSEMLSKQTKRSWSRIELERRYDLVPLDSLDNAGNGASLGDQKLLLMAQPRALSPGENVALDDWVRAGGKALIFADPLLTAGSKFAIGDRRRPQGAVLLSPILDRWGLEEHFDPGQKAGERTIDTDLAPLPVDYAGTLHLREGYPRSTEDCWIAYDRVFAKCAIGRGRVVIVADAALFEAAEGDSLDARREALDWLTSAAFSTGD